MSVWWGDAGRFFDGMLFGGGDSFNKGSGGSQNGYGGGQEHCIGCLGGVIGGSYFDAADSLRTDVGDSGRGDEGSAVMGRGEACVGSGSLVLSEGSEKTPHTVSHSLSICL